MINFFLEIFCNFFDQTPKGRSNSFTFLFLARTCDAVNHRYLRNKKLIPVEFRPFPIWKNGIYFLTIKELLMFSF